MSFIGLLQARLLRARLVKPDEYSIFSSKRAKAAERELGGF